MTGKHGPACHGCGMPHPEEVQPYGYRDGRAVTWLCGACAEIARRVEPGRRQVVRTRSPRAAREERR